MNKPAYPRLVADIGGTNARFGLATSAGSPPSQIQKLACEHYEDLAAAIRDYLAANPLDIQSSCIAVAGPIANGRVTMTNLPWLIDEQQLLAQLPQLKQVKLINDFQAIALSLPLLSPAQYLDIGPGITPTLKAPLAVMGPGSGLGVAQLIPGPESGDSYQAIATEGGYTGLSPATDLEIALFKDFLTQGTPCLREYFLSGPGIARIYQSLARIHDQQVPDLHQSVIVEQALQQLDAIAVLTLESFCALLGSAAGDQALATGARGGIYIAGGIVTRFQDFLLNSQFRKRFKDKGAMAHYLGGIPTRLILAPNPGLLGAAHYQF